MIRACEHLLDLCAEDVFTALVRSILHLLLHVNAVWMCFILFMARLFLFESSRVDIFVLISWRTFVFVAVAVALCPASWSIVHRDNNKNVHVRRSYALHLHIVFLAPLGSTWAILFCA